ncbi:hypothetical protein [Mycoplasma phocoeninasale]|uniref:hypothetical protein n=1 Tax=Mycoplasma phocoeninasale TaxID=2726117 RepID=UPI001968064C|nr:hypothetical protein [Mycoplasma phocoeninasale]MBN0970577.1 hypothetical protein [Mycoplasma phocoeninasale]
MITKLKISLKLTKTYYCLKIYSNTFEKSPFDKFIIACLILNTNHDKEKINNYVDNLAGNGSLNPIFKNIYWELINKDDEYLEKIRTNSLIPVQKIRDFEYVYYQDLDISVFNRKVYNGNLEDQDDSFFAQFLNEDEAFEYKNINIAKQDDEKDIYDVKVNEDNSLFIVINNQDLCITEDTFSSKLVLDFDRKKITEYSGRVHSPKAIENGIIMNNAKWEHLLDKNNKDTFIFPKENHYVFNLSNIVETIIFEKFSIIFYKENFLKYSKDMSRICSAALQQFYKNKKIEEMKVQLLTKLLDSVDQLEAQKYLNYLLSKKDSKELTLLGLNILNAGITEGWDKSLLLKFKEYGNVKTLITLYKINNNLEFTNDQIIKIYGEDSSVITTQEHLDIIKERNNIIKYIENTSGKISSSGIREKIKRKKPKDTKTQKFSTLFNKYIAHPDSDIKTLNDKELKNFRQKIQELYNLYDEIKDSFL